jgi:hypothetical protein
VDGISWKTDGPPESLGNEKSIWEHYNEMAAVDDNIREVEWRDLADTVLIFVCVDTLHDISLLMSFQDGLFAAFLSAFLVFLMPQLQSSSTDVAMDVLIHISQQLSNSTTPAFVPTAFQVSSNAAAVNMLFFLSLALVLIDAFLAMLVKGWLQEYDRGWRTYTIAHLRAQERERRLRELERWKLHELVALLPILIQVSVLLFCIGLLVLIFPLHRLSAIFCSIAFVSIFGFYGFITYVSIVNNYAPFSSPVSRLLARGLAIAQTYTRRITSTIPRRIHPHLNPQEQQTDADTSHETMQLLPSNNEVANPVQPHRPDGVDKGKVVPRSRSNIDPKTHIHVLERLVSTTAEVVENIPIFLELLDQPVKDATLRPSNVQKWKELFDITFGLLKDHSTIPGSAARTLARTMMICYNRETADRQLYLTLQHHFGGRETNDPKTRVPLNVLFSSYLRRWLEPNWRAPNWNVLFRTIAFLEPSDAADAELFWMVNTFHAFHRAMQTTDLFEIHHEFFVAVLTYVSSTEQSRRSNVPLTAAVIYAMHSIMSARDQEGIDSIDSLWILPGTISTSEPVPITFCPVAGIHALDLWSEGCIQRVKDLLQLDWGSNWHHDIQLSLIAALYIDSSKQPHAFSTFADLLKYTRITDIRSQYADAYDHGKLVVYWCMALSQNPRYQYHGSSMNLYGAIVTAITEHSILHLRILEIAVKHVHKTAPNSLDWLRREPPRLMIDTPEKGYAFGLMDVDHWVLLHLDTLLAPQPYIFREEKQGLKWSDTPEKVHIANSRLNLYDYLAKAEHEGPKLPKPDPELLRMFLWSKNFWVCTRAFRWCVELATISPPGAPGDADSTGGFIPETMGYEWVEHFVHVICKVDDGDGVRSWRFLKFFLIPKWTTLPSSWCGDFASAFIFSIAHSLEGHGLPAHQFLENAIGGQEIDERQAYLPFLATVLELIESKLSWARLASLEIWLAQLPETLENHNAHTQLEYILARRKQKLVEEALALFAELPMTDSWMDG